MSNAKMKATMNRNIRAMSKEDAGRWLDDYHAEKFAKGGSTIDMDCVRRITGGYASQSINFEVVRRVAGRLK